MGGTLCKIGSPLLSFLLCSLCTPLQSFIDRCTPWCNTHEPHAKISSGKKGYVIVLRTGPGMKECERIIATIEHFYGHMEIECCDRLGLCSVEYKEDLECRREEIEEFCNSID